MTAYKPFEGILGQNEVVTPAASSAGTTVTPSESIRLVNEGANVCHVRISSVAESATTGDLPVLSGEAIVVSKAFDFTNVSHVSASGTTLHVQPGAGGQ